MHSVKLVHCALHLLNFAFTTGVGDSPRSTKTPQYQAVLKNWGSLADSLLTSDNARSNLLRKFRSQPWISPTAAPDADGLIQVALKRILHDKKNYEVFVDMLEDIPEIEESLQKMTSKATTDNTSVWSE